MTKLANSADEELLLSWQAGDEDAGMILYDRHFASVARFFRSRVGDGLEDLLQSTFLACAERRTGERVQSFRAFLFGIARRQLFMYLRQRKKGGLLMPQTPSSVADAARTPSSVVAEKQRAGVLLNALAQLPLDCQIAIELTYWEQFSIEEVAQVLSITTIAAKARLARSKVLLRRAYERILESPEMRKESVGMFEKWAFGIRAFLRDEVGADLISSSSP